MSDKGDNGNDIERDAGPSPLLITDYEVTLLYDLMPDLYYDDVRHGIRAACECSIHPDDLAGIVRGYAGVGDGDVPSTGYNVPLAVYHHILQEARRSLNRNLKMDMADCKVSGTGIGVRYSGPGLARARDRMAELDPDSNQSMSLRSNLYVRFVLGYAD